MSKEEFEEFVTKEFPKAVPEKFRHLIKNVVFLVEDDSEELLGLYHGVPKDARGSYYGVGATLPDTITLFQKPIEDEALRSGQSVCSVIRDTIWHEVGHHFGLDEYEVRSREEKRKV
jgi:predicted Zn-dependent protease with MMP-like domain